MELSIIIVSHNVKDILADCITSIHQHLKGMEFEVIVIDNDSNDGTTELLVQTFPQINLIKNNFNAGFSYANNQGIRTASGEYIFLLNPDTYFIDDSLNTMLSYIKNENHKMLVAPKLLNKNMSVQVSAWKDKNLWVMFLDLFRIFIDRYSLDKFTMPEKVDNVAGAAAVFHKSLVNEIGYLDENLFWMEDFDFCYRLRKHGGNIMYFPATVIVHYGGASTNKNLSVAYANANISKLKFYKKHHSALSNVLAEILILIQILSRLLLFASLSPFHSASRNYCKAYAYALKKCFRYIFLNDVSFIS